MTKTSLCVRFGGAAIVHGFNGLTAGATTTEEAAGRLRRRAAEGLQGEPAMTLRIPRRQYADFYGPTTGDRIRLADTELLIEVERDLTVAGEEAKFGGGKVLRDGMGQSATATQLKAAHSIWSSPTR